MSATMEERVAALEERVARLEAPKRDVAYYEGVIVDAMKQWARVTALGFYVERNQVTGQDERLRPTPVEVPHFAAMFLGKAQRAAEDIAMVGAS